MAPAGVQPQPAGRARSDADLDGTKAHNMRIDEGSRTVEIMQVGVSRVCHSRSMRSLVPWRALGFCGHHVERKWVHLSGDAAARAVRLLRRLHAPDDHCGH